MFLFKEVLCRWGAIEEIVFNNGTPYVAALNWLARRYSINHICISLYNSCGNCHRWCDNTQTFGLVRVRDKPHLSGSIVVLGIAEVWQKKGTRIWVSSTRRLKLFVQGAL
jgi:hypothetical protein